MKYVTVLFTKTTRIHSERSLIVSPEILHTERDEFHDFTVLWTTLIEIRAEIPAATTIDAFHESSKHFKVKDSQ